MLGAQAARARAQASNAAEAIAINKALQFGLGGWHELMVDPVERQQQEHEERMAQRVPVQTHARDEYQREYVVARHVQVVVEHRPESHMRSTCKGVVMGIYEQCVEQGEHYGGNECHGAFFFSYQHGCQR